MAAEFSFDVVSEYDGAELTNALDQGPVVARPTRRVEVHDVQAPGAGLRVLSSAVDRVHRVRGLVREVTLQEANDPAAAKVKGRDDQHAYR